MVDHPYKTDRTPDVAFIEFDGANFKTVTWKVPEGVEYKGKIIYLHGFAEDSEMYIQLFDQLSKLGYECFFFDQRGAGETSPGKDYGLTNEAHVFKDLEFFIEYNLKLRKDPTEKFFLGGHSMGGGIVLNYGVIGKHIDQIKGIFACGPEVMLYNPDYRVKLLRPMVGILCKIVPNLKIDSQLDIDKITTDPKYREYIRANSKPLVGSINLYGDMFIRGERLLTPEYYKKFNKSTRLLIVHGTEDHVNDIEASKKFFDLVEIDDKDFFPSEGGYHSLFIEQEKLYKPVFEKLVQFLGK